MDCLTDDRDYYFKTEKIASQQVRVNALQLETIERYMVIGRKYSINDCYVHVMMVVGTDVLAIVVVCTTTVRRGEDDE